MATGRTYAGQTAQERQARRRAAFMEAGLELYGTKSYAAVTVPEIVEQAGQTRRAFYECFSDREDLLRAVDQELVRDQLVAQTQVAEVPVPDWPAARDLLDRILSFYAEDPRRAHVAFVAVAGVSEQMEAARRANGEALVNGFAALFGRRGGVSHAERRITAIGYLGAFSQLLIAYHALGADAEFAPIARELERLLRVRYFPEATN